MSNSEASAENSAPAAGPTEGAIVVEAIEPPPAKQETGRRRADEVPTRGTGAGGHGSFSLPTLGLVAIVVAAVALSLGLLRDLSDIIAPTFLALNLMIAAYPLYTGMRKVRTPKVVAALVTMLTVFIVLIVGVGAIVWCITQIVIVLSTHSAEFTSLYVSLINWLGQFGLDEQGLLDQLRSISPSSILNFAGSILSGTSAATSLIVVTLVGVVFMTMDVPSVVERLEILQRAQPGLTRSIFSVTLGIRRYWVVTTVFGLIVALINGGIITILGVSLPLVWIMLTFITNYIPNIGFVIGLFPPALLALVEKGPGAALAVIISFSVINFVLQSIIQPKFTGDAVGITPIVSFMSLLLWAWVFGALGVLIALPATLTVKALLIDPDPRLRWVNAFLSNEPRTAEAG